MYLVVSKWEMVPGHEAEAREKGLAMRKALKSQPEVKLLEHFQSSPTEMVVVMGYKDEASYKALIQDPQGMFVKALKEHNLEDHTRWVWSERGEAEPA